MAPFISVILWTIIIAVSAYPVAIWLAKTNELAPERQFLRLSIR